MDCVDSLDSFSRHRTFRVNLPSRTWSFESFLDTLWASRRSRSLWSASVAYLTHTTKAFEDEVRCSGTPRHRLTALHTTKAFKDEVRCSGTPRHLLITPPHRLTTPRHHLTTPSHRPTAPRHRLTTPRHYLTTPPHSLTAPPHRPTEAPKPCQGNSQNKETKLLQQTMWRPRGPAAPRLRGPERIMWEIPSEYIMFADLAIATMPPCGL